MRWTVKTSIGRAGDSRGHAVADAERGSARKDGYVCITSGSHFTFPSGTGILSPWRCPVLGVGQGTNGENQAAHAAALEVAGPRFLGCRGRFVEANRSLVITRLKINISDFSTTGAEIGPFRLGRWPDADKLGKNRCSHGNGRAEVEMDKMDRIDRWTAFPLLQPSEMLQGARDSGPPP